MDLESPPQTLKPTWRVLLGVVLALVVALGLMADQAFRNSATYDEPTYLRVAAHWWRTGEQAEIARMGSPLTFWKIQQAPTLWCLDRLGYGAWIDGPIGHQSQLLPWVRLGSLWIAAVALILSATWAQRRYGPRAMVLAAWMFAFSPNLMAHGSLATMEMPLVAASAATFALFDRFLQTGNRRPFLICAVMAGVAWSCKFTAVLLPPILGLIWWLDLWFQTPATNRLRKVARTGLVVVRGMFGFGLILLATNLILTGFACIPLSANSGTHPAIEARLPHQIASWASWLVERPTPQDWVAFAVQTAHQRNGGPSYLFGETRMTGWSYYYLVALAVKTPLALAVLLVARTVSRRVDHGSGQGVRRWYPILVVLLFVALASIGSKRNYGIRYLLPVAVPAIVWISGLAEGGRKTRLVAWLGVAGMGIATLASHPHELSYFNALAGGPVGGRRILADSNLDWGQGLRQLARLQNERPEFRDLTLYYFGDTEPRHYGIVGRAYTIDANHVPDDLPPAVSATTRYLAVSTSLQWGPWGPPGYFRQLNDISPLARTGDATIAIYPAEAVRLETRPGPGYSENRD